MFSFFVFLLYYCIQCYFLVTQLLVILACWSCMPTIFSRPRGCCTNTVVICSVTPFLQWHYGVINPSCSRLLKLHKKQGVGQICPMEFFLIMVQNQFFSKFAIVFGSNKIIIVKVGSVQEKLPKNKLQR